MGVGYLKGLGVIRAYSVERTVLVILIWGLILEVATLLYFSTSAQTWRFEFQYTLILLAITVAALAVFICRVVRRVRSSVDAG
jgi:uncharacterized membrane protein